jgi:hypothetical protein
MIMKKLILLATLCLAVSGNIDWEKLNEETAQQYKKSAIQTVIAFQNLNQQISDYVKKNPELRPECSYPMFKGRKSCKTDADCNMAWEYCDENCKKCRPTDNTY